MKLTFPAFRLPTFKWMFRGTIAKATIDVMPEHETAYAERAFLSELLDRNPEGIQSDIGLMAMMSQ